ncbi:MAG: GlxA family transcriptional regulator, partial [Acetobacteraceae bacterium]|nr:GlxA family transcriptional regulator [Acetobacteraceae bacterium]
MSASQRSLPASAATRTSSAARAAPYPAPAAPRSYAFALIASFSMMSVCSAIEPLRAANRLLGRETYRWTLLSADGAPVRASN